MNPYKLQGQNGMPYSMGMASMLGGPASSMPLMGGAGGGSMGNTLGTQSLYPSFSQMQQMQQQMPFQQMPPGPSPSAGSQHMSSSTNPVGGGAGMGSGPLSSNMGMPPYPGMNMSGPGPSPYSDPTQYSASTPYPRYPGSYSGQNPATSMSSSGPPAMPLMSGPPPPPIQSPLGMSPGPMHPHAGMGGNPMAAAGMGSSAGGGSGMGPGPIGGPPGMAGPGANYPGGPPGPLPDQPQPLPAPARKRPLAEELGADGLATKAQKSEIGQIMQRLDTMAAQQTQQLNQRMESFEQKMEQRINGLDQKMESLTAMVQAACHNSQARAFNSRGQGRATDPLKPLQVESGPKTGTAPPSTGSNRQRNHYGAQFPATLGEAQKLDSLHLAALSEFYGVPFPDYSAFAYFIGCA